jgi:hypothetical protein
VVVHVADEGDVDGVRHDLMAIARLKISHA